MFSKKLIVAINVSIICNLHNINLLRYVIKKTDQKCVSSYKTVNIE